MQVKSENSKPSREVNLPNFIIGGAPKCGTSSLFEWLRTHPQVCASNVKEPRYLLDDPTTHPDTAHYSIHSHGIEGYGAFFRPGPEQSVLVEASPQYIHSRTALEVLPNLPSQPLILFIIREPARRVYSSFRYDRFNLKKINPETGLYDYLDSKKGKFEVELSHYTRYLDQWKDALDKDSLRVWVFEEMVRQPMRHMLELSDWLGINRGVWTDFKFSPRNPTLDIRHRKLHRLAEALNPMVPESVAKMFLPLYYRINGRPLPGPDPDDMAIIEELREQYKASNQQLEDLFDLDLSAWST